MERVDEGNILDMVGLPLVVSPFLPIAPGVGEDARRIVRHGLAGVLRWLGEEVGPRPGEALDAFVVQDGPGRGTLVVSRELAERLARLAPRAGRL